MKPADLFINGNLTPNRAKIVSTLRRIKREKPSHVSAVGSRDGRVFAWLKLPNSKASGVKRTFNSMKDVEKVCDDLNLNFAELLGHVLQD